MKIKTGGKKFDEQKYERKIRAPGDKLFTHQFQTAERILAPDWAESASIRSAFWNWCVKSLSPGARIFLLYFCSSNFFLPVLIFVFGPTICPWVSEDGNKVTKTFQGLQIQIHSRHYTLNKSKKIEESTFYNNSQNSCALIGM